jgi:hypothetical protein
MGKFYDAHDRLFLTVRRGIKKIFCNCLCSVAACANQTASSKTPTAFMGEPAQVAVFMVEELTSDLSPSRPTFFQLLPTFYVLAFILLTAFLRRMNQ